MATNWSAPYVVTAKFDRGVVTIPNPAGGDVIGNVSFSSAVIDSLMVEYQVAAVAKTNRAWPDTVDYVVSVTNESRTSYLLRDVFEFAVTDSSSADDLAGALSEVESVVWASAPNVCWQFWDGDPYVGPHVENPDFRNQGFIRAWTILDDLEILPLDPQFTVGVIDDGVDDAHSDLAGLVGGDSKRFGAHGTAVAGVIASKRGNDLAIAGGAQVEVESKAFHLVLDPNPLPKRLHALLTTDGLRVANYSYGSGYDDIGVRYACAEFYNANKILVVAAGNNELPYVAYPAAYPSCWAVSGATRYGVRPYTSLGPEIDFAAFSEQWVPLAATAADVAYRTGTSYAAPVVVGAASLLLMANPDLYNDDVYNLLAMSARSDSLNPDGYSMSHAFGHGLVDAAAALDSLLANHLVVGEEHGVSRTSVDDLGVLLLASAPDNSVPTGLYYQVSRVRCELDVQFPTTFVSAPHSWGRGVGTDGIGLLIPRTRFYLDLKRHCEVESGSVTESGCTLVTYVYRLERQGDQAVFWYPVEPGGNMQWQWAALGKDWVSGVTHEAGERPLRLSAVPNPFNAHTVASFDNPQLGIVTAAVYDLRGRRIATLHHGLLLEGTHEWRWDGRDADGRACPSAVYVLRVESAFGNLSRSVILVK